MFSVHIDGENLELLPLLPGAGAQVKPLLERRARAGGELWDGAPDEPQPATRGRWSRVHRCFGRPPSPSQPGALYF